MVLNSPCETLVINFLLGVKHKTYVCACSVPTYYKQLIHTSWRERIACQGTMLVCCNCEDLIFDCEIKDSYICSCPLKSAALPTSGQIQAGSIWYLKGALRIQSAIAALVAAKELKIQAGFISNTWAQGENMENLTLTYHLSYRYIYIYIIYIYTDT